MLRHTLLTAALLAATALPVLAQEGPLLVYVSPNPIGVNDFLKLGQQGTERVAAALGGSAKAYESTDPTTMRQNLEAAAQEADIIIAISFQFDDILPEVAAAYPDKKFLVVDSCPRTLHDNIFCSVFREYEASFLAGAVAGLTSETGKVGAIGALDIPFIHRYTDPFLEGAKHVNAEIETAPSLWVGGDNPFSDPARGQQRALVMVSDNVDRVMAAGAGTNGGIFQGMEELPGAAAFGVDVNQCPQAPGLVMDNVEKRTDVVIEQGVQGIVDGTQPQVAALGLSEGGMTLTSLSDTVADSGCLVADYPEVIARVKELRDEIVAGTLVVADPMQMGGN